MTPGPATICRALEYGGAAVHIIATIALWFGATDVEQACLGYVISSTALITAAAWRAEP